MGKAILKDIAGRRGKAEEEKEAEMDVGTSGATGNLFNGLILAENSFTFVYSFLA